MNDQAKVLLVGTLAAMDSNNAQLIRITTDYCNEKGISPRADLHMQGDTPKDLPFGQLIKLSRLILKIEGDKLDGRG